MTESDTAAAARAARRDAMRELAVALRRCNDAAATTGVAPDALHEIAGEVAALAAQLEAVHHPGPYSGLLGDRGAAWTDPHDFLPLMPMAGEFNPIAPPLRIEIVDGCAVGRVTLHRQHTGPPGVAHGGSLASICDQMVAAAGWCAGIAGVTKWLRVEFRKPAPLDVELVCEAVARRVDDRRATSEVTIHAGDVLCVRAEAETVAARGVTNL